MLISDKIQLLSVGVALFLGLVSLGISLYTIIQNSKMFEESTRPRIILYSKPGENIEFIELFIKNTGKSCAVIKSFTSDFDFFGSNAYSFNLKDYMASFITLTIPPDLEYKLVFKRDRINKPVVFDIAYESNLRLYREKIKINLTAGIDIAYFN